MYLDDLPIEGMLEPFAIYTVSVQSAASKTSLFSEYVSLHVFVFLILAIFLLSLFFFLFYRLNFCCRARASDKARGTTEGQILAGFEAKMFHEIVLYYCFSHRFSDH